MHSVFQVKLHFDFEDIRFLYMDEENDYVSTTYVEQILNNNAQKSILAAHCVVKVNFDLIKTEAAGACKVYDDDHMT